MITSPPERTVSNVIPSTGAKTQVGFMSKNFEQLSSADLVRKLPSWMHWALMPSTGPEAGATGPEAGAEAQYLGGIGLRQVATTGMKGLTNACTLRNLSLQNQCAGSTKVPADSD